MPGSEASARQLALDRLGKPQQPERVRDRRAALADARGDLFLRVTEVVEQALVRRRFLERREVVALDVLDERELEALAIGDLAHDDRHLAESGETRRAEAPLTGDELVAAVAVGADEQRLQNPLGADRSGELVQRRLVEVGARLARVRPDAIDRRLALGLDADGRRHLAEHRLWSSGNERVESGPQGLPHGHLLTTF